MPASRAWSPARARRRHRQPVEAHRRARTTEPVARATIAVFPGDGIGPEVTAEAVAVLEAAAPRHELDVTFTSGVIGGAAIDACGAPLPAAELERARGADAVLLGAVGGPKWDNPAAAVRPEQALLGLRRALGLYANLRPVRAWPELVAASPLRPEILTGVDLIVVRELTGGIYFGKPSERRTTAAGREAVDTLVYSEEEIARLLHAGFALARQRRRRLASVDKANLLASSRLWREIAHQVAREYPDVTHEYALGCPGAADAIERAVGEVVAAGHRTADLAADGSSIGCRAMGQLVRERVEA